MYDVIANFENTLAEYERHIRASVDLQHLLDNYSIESMDDVELHHCSRYIETALTSNGFDLEEMSLEDSDTPASDAALGNKEETPGKGAKLKALATKTLETIRAKAGDIAKNLKEAFSKMTDFLSQNTKVLTNTAKQLKARADNKPEIASTIKGPFSTFESRSATTILADLKSSLESLEKTGKPILDAVTKAIREGSDTRDESSIKLTLKTYEGESFEYDGTVKFINLTHKAETKEVKGWSLQEITQVCSAIESLANSIDSLKTVISANANATTHLDLSNGTNTVEVNKAFKHLMFYNGFYRKIIVGYIKYSFKLSKVALSACDKSMSSKETS